MILQFNILIISVVGFDNFIFNKKYNFSKYYIYFCILKI
jgi:hypothetical protein